MNRTGPLDQMLTLPGAEGTRVREEVARLTGLDPSQVAEFAGPMPSASELDRRRLLRLMAASLALGGLTACDSQPAEKIVPYVRQPPRLTPGEPMYYASSHVLDGIANGTLVQTVNGRPIKIEGNLEHPVTRGGTDVFMQASVLDLYDPDRSQAVTRLGRVASAQALDGALFQRAALLDARRGEGLSILTGPLTSPSLVAAIEELLIAWPQARWHVHSPVSRANVYDGARLAFGEVVETLVDYRRAELVVAIDGDFLDVGPHQVATSRAWMETRRRLEGEGRLAELHAVASTPTLTAAKADHRLLLAPGAIPALVDGLLARIEGRRIELPPEAVAWVERSAAALLAHRGRSAVTAGLTQPASVHALVHHLNARLGNVGTVVAYTDPLLARAGVEEASIERLATEIAGGAVSSLVMLEVNPVYTAAPELEFGRLVDQVEFSMHVGSQVDETAVHCTWHAPLAHLLETWGDARALDGTVSIIQPTIRPLYSGRTAGQVLAGLRGLEVEDALVGLRRFWAPRLPGPDTEAAWHEVLRAGFVPGTALPPRQPRLRDVPPSADLGATAAETPLVDVLFRPDPTVWDGSRANNAWLQELPKPFTKLSWDNALLVSPGLAAVVGARTGDLLELEQGGRRLRGPAIVTPGQADATITITLGNGRNRAGAIGSGIGYDAYAFRPSTTPWHLPGVTVRSTGESVALALSQPDQGAAGYEFARVQPIGGAHEGEHAEAHGSLYPPYPDQPHSWGMVIDLDSCIGCNACMVGCQSENNNPVVGPDQVAMGRDLYWIRVDAYFGHDEGGTPSTVFQPVPCMHCELAPCEVGCPVEATLHDFEGLNLQVYNRCIGTRTCSSYCPYKVRRFNYFDYAGAMPASVTPQRNPEVTVRARGVMEKCTYCVQRIAGARIQADLAGRPIADGEVVTACQSACPTRAITFGNIKDPDSAVSAARRSGRHYALLEELNTRPRTTYLAALRPHGTEEGEG